MRNSILLCLVAIVYSFGARAEPANFIGRSVGGVVLKISPDGKWLTVAAPIEDKIGFITSARISILNLQTSKFQARKISLDKHSLYGWTDDNRLYYFSLWSLKAKLNGKLVSAICEIEKPDGTGHVVFEKPPESSFIHDFVFSTKVGCFFTIDSTFYRIYDAFSGKLIFERPWNLVSAKISSRHFDPYGVFLSPEGDCILADEQIVTKRGSHATGIHVVLDADTGMPLSRIPYNVANPSFVRSRDFIDVNSIKNYQKWLKQYCCRGSIGDSIWERELPRSIYELQNKDELLLTDPETHKDVKYMPPRGAWRDVAISPDRKTLYVIDTDGKIFHFPSR